jgi:cytochrome c oxidase assembly protein subunit 11
MLRVSANPAIDTVIKLVTVSVAMFAFVFVVMVPLYNVLCDALGINGKTAGEAYTAVQAGIDESREITVQFVATNNDGMPWEFPPDADHDDGEPRCFQRHRIPGPQSDGPGTWWRRPFPAYRRRVRRSFFTRPSASVSTSSRWTLNAAAAEMPLQFIIDRDLPAGYLTPLPCPIPCLT